MTINHTTTSAKLSADQVDILDYSIFPGHVDIDFQIDGSSSAYSIGVGLAHAARVLEGLSEIRIKGILGTEDGRQRIVTIQERDWEEFEVESNLFDLISDLLPYRLEDFVCDIWNIPQERDEYVTCID